MHYCAGAGRSAEPGVPDGAHDRDGVAVIPPVVAHEKVKHVLVAARDALLHGVTETDEHPLDEGLNPRRPQVHALSQFDTHNRDALSLNRDE